MDMECLNQQVYVKELSEHADILDPVPQSMDSTSEEKTRGWHRAMKGLRGKSGRAGTRTDGRSHWETRRGRTDPLKGAAAGGRSVKGKSSEWELCPL